MFPVCFAESQTKSAAINIYSACEFISQSTAPKMIVAQKLLGSQTNVGDPEDRAAQYCPILQA